MITRSPANIEATGGFEKAVGLVVLVPLSVGTEADPNSDIAIN
jgi:hypothetical protein